MELKLAIIIIPKIVNKIKIQSIPIKKKNMFLERVSLFCVEVNLIKCHRLQDYNELHD